jgi:hypothetical protein
MCKTVLLTIFLKYDHLKIARIGFEPDIQRLQRNR